MAQTQETEILLTIDLDKAKKDLAALTKQIEELNSASDTSEEEVKQLEKQWDQLSETIKKAEKAQQPLDQRLKDVQKQLQLLKYNGQENTAEYQKLIAEAGRLKDAMGDTASAINKTASDTANLDAALGALSAASGGFGLVTSAMSMFGGESEKAEKMQKRLLQAISLVNSVQQLSNALNKDSALMVKVNALANSLLAKTMQTTATATNTATTAMKGFRAALVKTGVGALVVLLGFAVNKMLDYVESTREATDATDDLKEKLESVKDVTYNTAQELEKLSDDYANLIMNQKLRKAIDDRDKAIKKSNTAFAQGAINEEKHLQDLINAQQKYTNALKKETASRLKEIASAYGVAGNLNENALANKVTEQLTEAEEAYQSALRSREAIKNTLLSYELRAEELSEDEKKQVQELVVELDKQNKSIDSLQANYERIKGDLSEINTLYDNQKNAVNALKDAEDALQTWRINKAREYLQILQDVKKATGESFRDLQIQFLELKAEEAKGDPEEYAKARTAVVMAQAQKEIETEEKKNKEKVKLNEDAHKELVAILKEQGNSTEEADETFRKNAEALQKEYTQKMINIELDKNIKLRQIQEDQNAAMHQLRQADLYDWLDTAQAMGSILESIGEIQDDGSEKAFDTMKKTQIAGAMVTGLSGAAGAFAQAAGSIAPPAGPIIGAANAAAVLASTAARIAGIKRQKWNAPSESASASAGSTSAATVNTGTSSVARAIISRNISPIATDERAKMQTVLVVDDVTARQMEQEKINRVSTI